jgi:hypothetical protein
MEPRCNITVKSERADDAEIRAIAESMRITNDLRMITNQRAQALQNRPGVPGAPLQQLAAPLDNENAIDINSKKGQFGWHVFRNIAIPYIFRHVVRIKKL